MALSDDERRKLEQLEKELAAADPELDQKLQTGLARRRAAAIYGAIAAAAGVVFLLAGLITNQLLVGVIGFFLMTGGTYQFLRGRKARSNGTGKP